MQPFLFGPVGAQLEFSKINPSILGNCFALIIVALILRSIATFVSTYVRRDYTVKERIFIAICWSPKAAV
jgi:NhaP-type Na+/H+ or K+/H+ antiporter